MALPTVTAVSSSEYSHQAAPTSIPVIDMNDWYAQDSARRKKFVQGLDKAFREVGFVAVVNPDIDSKALDLGYEEAQAFFQQHDVEKLKLFDPSLSGQRGYTPGETAKGFDQKDLKEFLHVGREYTQEELERLKYKKNIWPQEGKLKPSLLALLSQLEKYMDPFLEAIAEAIGQPMDFLKNMTREGDCILRALHYFPKPEGTIVGAEHTDIDLIAILPRATCEGLQVQNKEGVWIDAKVPEGSFVINAGDMLQSLTNGYYTSARHRIVAPKGEKDRYSMVLFVHPRPNDPVGPLQEYIKKTGGVQKHPAGTRDEYLFERLIELNIASKELAAGFVKTGFIERRIALGVPSIPCIERLIQMGLIS
jgi:isopenicillin N synthase-like dioxygenase